MDLPEDLEDAFRTDVFHYETEKHMPYQTSIERHALKEGREQGFREGIAVALEAKFGKPGRKLLPQVRELQDLAALRALSRALLKSATTLDEVRKLLPQGPNTGGGS
jgi:hypothetical protein